MQATKKPHNYHKTVVWQKDDRIRKSPLKFYVYYYSELSGDCQVSIFTELWRLSVAFCVTLWHMSIGTGVVRAVALQQIHHAPHAKARAEGHNEGLQDFDCAVEEFHGDLLLTIKSLRPRYTPEILFFISCQPQRRLICRCILGPGVNKKSSRDGRIAVLFSRMTGFPHKRRQHSLLSPLV